MTRAEYDAIMAQKEAIASKLEDLSWHICEILTGIGIRNDGRARITDIEGVLADVRYLQRASHGSCCGEEWETAQIPVYWIFGEVDWRAEHAKNKAMAEEMQKDLDRVAEEKERLEQEQRDKDEFQRLKSKFEPTQGDLK